VPKGNWGHQGCRHPGERLRLFPRLEATPDVNRGEARFVGEVMLLVLNREPIPIDVLMKAQSIAGVLARG
jgi:hypothetical protein